uniref:Uncharacterized protein n=1 Tax=Skeletonema marinoi TaxID=267567 RepID=A0A7S2PJ99_9STRA|mmetsp:Transcript_23831/g.40579  ORF Transcript_23831/g.40579 Transcript_23831/m.40579 type:complete len:314 (+) Transcript_23831:250-1191(+)
MTSLTNSNNHRRTKPKPKAKHISDDNNMTAAATTTIGMKSLKESLSSMILQDAETKEQRQRHNKRGISSGAQKIMDKLASLRSDDVVHQAASCHRNNDNHRRRRRPSQLNNDNTNNDKGDQPLPRLIGVHNTSSSSSLDTSSYSYSSFASYNNSSSSTTLDASFASSSLDDSLRRLSLPSNTQRLEKDDYNNDKYNRNDNINIMTASTSTNIHNEQQQPPPPHKKEQQPTTTTITRRKSIPRHRNSELNSSISSILRHPAKYNTSTTSSSSDRSIDTRRTFNSSMEDFNDSCSSWVAPGVVIAESMEVIHMNE